MTAVPDLATALRDTSGRCCVTLNLAQQENETAGFSPETYLEVLLAHAPDLRIDAVLADPSAVDRVDSLTEVCTAFGARLVLRHVSRGDGTPRHDPLRLAAAYRDVFAGQTADF